LTENLELEERHVINTGRYLDAAPYLASLKGQIGIVYRDDRDEDDTAEFYFAKLDSSGAATLPPKRISRSDGYQGPRISGGLPVFSATVRSFQRELLIGVNRFDLKGEKLGGEFQIYADKSNFTLVAIAAGENNAMLIYAEDMDGKSRVLAGSVVCKSGS
jgi:hypothetical protein